MDKAKDPLKKAIDDFKKEKESRKDRSKQKPELSLSKRRVSRPRKAKNCGLDKEDNLNKKITIDIVKHPEIYEHLQKSAEANFRTIEQQALYYIWTALNIEENGKK